ncbi:hypothetical protein SUGI_0978520 [Cryptomeria japonica]|nr:hypothetical protein SUGI_0978520 [Cryptomeria japonica]
MRKVQRNRNFINPNNRANGLDQQNPPAQARKMGYCNNIAPPPIAIGSNRIPIGKNTAHPNLGVEAHKPQWVFHNGDWVDMCANSHEGFRQQNADNTMPKQPQSEWQQVIFISAKKL